MNQEPIEDYMEKARQQYREEAEKAEPFVKAALSDDKRVLLKQPFAESEGWLTYTLYWLKSPMPLEGFIGMADALNHTLAAKEEIAWTFVQLRNRGWLLVDGDKYGLTSEARRIVSDIIGAYERNPVEQTRRLDEWFKKNPPLAEEECREEI